MIRRGFLVYCLLAGISFEARAAETSAERIDAAIRAAGYENGHWGLLVVDDKTGETVLARNPDQLFCPASVTKLFSTAAAWVELGPDHRFRTPLVRRGDARPDGTLPGELILVASGDLSLGGRTSADGTIQFVDDDHTYANGNPHSKLTTATPLAGLDALAQGVVTAGIKSVDDVLVDARLFEEAASTGSGPTRVSPMLVNDNLIDIEVTPAAKAGDPAKVRQVPATQYMMAEFRVETTDASQPPALTVTPAGPRRFAVRGHVPLGHEPILKVVEVDDPASFARTLLIESLRRHGVSVKAAAITDNDGTRLPSSAEVHALPKVAELVSPPLSESIKLILKVSHNLHASSLPLLLAVKHGQRTLTDGLKVEGTALRSLGVEARAVSFGGGAGGSRSDLVTPRATVTLLRALEKRPDFAAYAAALPILGQDGTLARSVTPDSPARGKVRAKTGTYWVDNALDGQAVLTSKALAGYLETASGRRLVFAIFVNGVPLGVSGDKVSDATAAAGRLLGKICEILHADSP